MKAPSSSIRKLRDFDILFGRGGKSNHNNGNKRYQLIVESRAWEYADLKGRNEKTNMAWEIVSQMKQEGARFLRKDKRSGFYFEVDGEDCRRKVSQRLREKAKEMREYSSEGSQQIQPAAVKSAHDSDGSLSSIFDACFLNEPWYKEGQEGGVLDEPEILPNSSSDLSPLSSEWCMDQSDYAICGEIDDLSSCSLATLAPMTFAYKYSFDWADNMAIGATAVAHQEQKISHSFATKEPFPAPPQSRRGDCHPDTCNSDESRFNHSKSTL